MKKYFHKHAIIAVLVCIVALIVSISKTFAEPSQLEPVTLKVLLLPFLSFAPFFIAEEEGYFSEQGLQIEFVKAGRSAEAIPSLVMGKLDVFGGVVGPALLNAMARGSKIRFVADRTHIALTDCTVFSLMPRRSLVEAGKLDTLSQLQGKRIALEPMNTMGYYIEKLLQTADLSLDDIQVVDIPYPVMPEAIEKGEIDAAVIGEPWVTRLLQGGYAVSWMPAQQIIPNYQVAFVVFGPTMLEGTFDVGRRFMIAYLKAVRQYNRGKTDRNVEILAAHTGLDKKFLKQACWPSIRNDGQINTTSVLDYQRWAMNKGYIDTLIPEEQFWEPQFVEYANRILNTSP